jgi:prevent-host-death family protein
MAGSNVWKLQDAKARFSEVVRRARAGEPQQVTVHGKEAVLVIDPERFEVRAKQAQEETLAGFVKRSEKYRARRASDEVEFDQSFEMNFPASPFDEDEK